MFGSIHSLLLKVCVCLNYRISTFSALTGLSRGCYLRSKQEFLASCTDPNNIEILQAEVQSIQHDGTVMLHTRSNKYGRLGRGRAVRVPAELVRRQRQHFQQLEGAAVDIILGCNGVIWVTPHTDGENVSASVEAERVRELPDPSPAERGAVARAAQSILALAALGLPLQGDSISKAVNLSIVTAVRPCHMLDSTFLTALAAAEQRQRQGTDVDVD
jgi:exosome complex component RRP4